MRSVLYTAVVLAGLVFPATAKAAIVNGGFEDSFTSWETIGETSIATTAFGSGSVEGTAQAFLSTAFNEVIAVDASGNQTVGGNAACASLISGFCDNNLETFLGLSSFLGDKSLFDIATAEPIEGSAIKQTFTAVAGQTLSFAWNFLTNESVDQAANDDFTYPDYNDLAFVSIQSNAGSELLTLADTIAGFTTSTTRLFDSETGFQTFTYTIPTDGEYTLGIGVVDVGEATRISGLLVDRAAVVPETSATLGLLFLGTCGSISVLKRNRKKID